MNRQQRRAQAAQQRKLSRTESIELALATLANAGPTATGATLILPDGSTQYLSADDARAMHGDGKPGGRA